MARITIVQASWDAHDPADNLRSLQEHVEANAKSDLLVFPELAVHGHDVADASPRDMHKALRAADEEAEDAFHDVVQQAGHRVVYGRIRRVADRLLNVATYVGPEGVVDYAKTHVHWTENFQPGDQFPVVSTPIGNIGMLICYDAAFSEVPRLLTLHGAEIIVNISAIPDEFPVKHLHRRATAAAVFNQVYSIFANRTGNGFLGGSIVIDPQGEAVATADDKQTVLHADIDPARVAEWRHAEPILPYRRPGIYAPMARYEDQNVALTPVDSDMTK